jgi:hypothetical protein
MAFVGAVYVASKRSDTPASAFRRSTMAATGTAIWLFAVAAVVRSGVLSEAPMPRLPLFLAGCNAMGVAVALSPVGRWLASGISIPTLVLFQAFRLPLELILHDWVRQGAIPETMTWTGSNFDVATGVFALTTAPLAGRSRLAAWIANVVGFVLLLNVLRVALLSAPLPFAWPLAQPLVLAFHLPFAWIVPVCVAGALGGHIVLTRALILHSQRTRVLSA